MCSMPLNNAISLDLYRRRCGTLGSRPGGNHILEGEKIKEEKEPNKDDDRARILFDISL